MEDRLLLNGLRVEASPPLVAWLGDCHPYLVVAVVRGGGGVRGQLTRC